MGGGGGGRLPMQLLAGNGNPELAEEISARLTLALALALTLTLALNPKP
jgi:hypothetical protein